MWLPIFAAATGMACAILMDIITSRLGVSRTSAYGMSFMCGLVVAIATMFLDDLSSAVGGEEFGASVLALMLYGTWWFIFLNFVQSFDSSLRVRIMTILYDASGRLRRVELYRSYSDQLILELRLERLRKGGYVVERDGRLFVSSTTLKFLARFFRALKVALLGRRSEFDQSNSGQSK
jgi:hypothetical protein